MKKYIILASVVIAFAVQGEAIEVKVSNLAGFATVPVKPESNLIGSPFVRLDGKTTDINNLFSWKTFLGIDDFFFQSMILAWNDDEYHYYGWCGFNQGTEELNCPVFDGKWISYTMDAVATNAISDGHGFWFTTTANQTIVLAGQVCTNAIFTVTITNRYNLLCNPFPAPINIQDVGSSDLIADDGVNAFQWEMRLWTGVPDVYDFFAWCNEGEGTAKGVPEFDAKWLNINMTEVADETIGIGEAFWIEVAKPLTVTIKRPASLDLVPNNGK